MTFDAYRYQKKWRYDRAHGRTRTMPAAKVRAHIQALYMAGMSQSSIASAAGVEKSTIGRLFHGEQPTIRKVTAEKIMAVTGPLDTRRDADDETFVPRLGSLRRIQALQAIGWRYSDINADSGVKTHLLVSTTGGWVTYRNHRRIAETYERLCMTPGPSARTRAMAAAKGWAPPLAWDEGDLDDPEATPNIDGREAA